MLSSAAAPRPDELGVLEDAWASLGASERRDPIVGCDRMSGGVSSDVWRCTLASGRHIVAKRALPRLRVAVEWLADPRRGRMEARWLRLIAEEMPSFAPRVLGYVADDCLLFMQYLDETRFANWRTELLAGRCDIKAGRELGAGVAIAHNLFAGRSDLRASFQARDILLGTRIDPYFDAVAAAHPATKQAIAELANQLLDDETVVIHGDVSPKNVLVGDGGPILLDAECACVGEPAFDPAFFLAQLCLKSIVCPDCAIIFYELGMEFIQGYLGTVNFASNSEIDPRVVRYLALFMLGRIDGKVPVPYLQDPAHREFGRRFALAMFESPPMSTADLLGRWCNDVLRSNRR